MPMPTSPADPILHQSANQDLPLAGDLFDFGTHESIYVESPTQGSARRTPAAAPPLDPAVALEAAVLRTARLLRERANIPASWLAGVEFELTNASLKAAIDPAHAHGATALLYGKEDGRWHVSGEICDSFKEGGMQLHLANKGASLALTMTKLHAEGQDMAGACSLLCEVLEREAANKRVLEYFEQGGAQVLKATSYALARLRIPGIAPVLANMDEAQVRTVCFKHNQDAGFAGMVVDKTAEFAVVAAGATGVLGFIPLETFPQAKQLAVGDALALRVSPTRGLLMHHIEPSSIREAVEIACGTDSETPEVPRVRALLMHQFGDREQAFTETASLEVARDLSLTLPSREQGTEWLKLRKAWQPAPADAEGIATAVAGVRGIGMTPRIAETLEDRAFGSEELVVRKGPAGFIQALAVFRSGEHYSAEAMQFDSAGKLTELKQVEKLSSVERARALGEKLCQSLREPEPVLAAPGKTTLRVAGKVSIPGDLDLPKPGEIAPKPVKVLQTGPRR